MRSIMRCAVALIILMAVAASAAYAGDFSADVVSSSQGGPSTGRLWVSGDKSRMEMPRVTIISRMDKKVVWVLMSSQKMYIEQPINLQTVASTQDKIYGEIERTAEGNENISGRSTTKYRIIFEANGKRESIFQWIDKSAHIPVKTSAIDGSWSSESRNIQLGPQDPTLFEIPAGYSKMPDM